MSIFLHMFAYALFFAAVHDPYFSEIDASSSCFYFKVVIKGGSLSLFCQLQELDSLPPSCETGNANCSSVASPSKTKLQDPAASTFSPKLEFDDADIDDDLDPAMKEELDRLDGY